MVHQRGRRFRYEDYSVDPGAATLTFRYTLDGRKFTEALHLDPEGDWSSEALPAVARLVFLLAGISYYKTGAPPVIDLGEHGVSSRELAFLRSFYIQGLGEFAHVNGLDLSGLCFEASTEPPQPGAGARPPLPTRGRPLVPFGGGIDSIVVAERTRARYPDTCLFILSTAGGRYPAIEAAAQVSGLPVARAARTLDPQVLESRQNGFLNGHVPITGILSGAAVVAAVLGQRETVVMSNEWSASVPTLVVGEDREVNHQYSKSLSFESAFREELADAVPGLTYFSALRPYSELWVAKQFASLAQYHSLFRSCNRAFYQEASRRLGSWCGECDKCCFIDLVLAPFLPPGDLAQIFAGKEPLADPHLTEQFQALLGVGAQDKPFECVGDAGECRAAAALAADRADRAGFPLLQQLAAEARAAEKDLQPDRYMQPMGPHFVSPDYAAKSLLV